MSRLKFIEGAKRASQARDFGKVAVLLGGDSSEREISLISGNAVLAALKRRGIDAHAFDPKERPVQSLVEDGFDRAWNILHGPGGEDGAMQGAQGAQQPDGTRALARLQESILGDNNWLAKLLHPHRPLVDTLRAVLPHKRAGPWLNVEHLPRKQVAGVAH